ncbi:MAG: DUF4419 domain-containing protein, partial [Bacteroidales bacterium]|nr:DUF4419 domain-containing protein [Bacteroidales bacterium]
MRTLSSIAIFICLAAHALGQNEIKFQVEELSAPEKALYTTDINDVYQPLILSDAHLPLYRAKGDTSQFRFNIITQSNAPDSLVCFGYHSFFNGMYQAYADHRPFVLSPDMIWLLISQGFARHLSANSESLRHHFVDFDGKLSLVLESKQDLLDTGVHSKDWETIFPQFTAQIATHTGEELMTILSSNFSTTTAVEKVAAEITIMEAMEPYFEFVVINIVCGIPEITLTGTPEDWQKVYNK